jgi:hypothetical protein
MRTKNLRTLYWVVTLLFVVPQAWSAIQYLTEAPRMTATITELGYPLYFMKILAGAKLLGIGAILYGRPAMLKEWAYAGFTFDASAAFLSHLSVGDPPYVALIPLLFVAVQLTSYFLWKRASPSAVASPAKATPLWRGPAAQKRA